MTDRSRGLPVAAIAAALFCVVLIYLALQVRAGRDPAIGPAEPPAAPRQVLVRRIIVRRIVEEPATATRAPAAQADTAGASAAPSAPPAEAAPAPPPPAAPAPAPAPVTTGGS